MPQSPTSPTTTQLPPISMFARPHPPTILPVSPPQTAHEKTNIHSKSMPILPKPHNDYNHHSPYHSIPSPSPPSSSLLLSSSTSTSTSTSLSLSSSSSSISSSTHPSSHNQIYSLYPSHPSSNHESDQQALWNLWGQFQQSRSVSSSQISSNSEQSQRRSSDPTSVQSVLSTDKGLSSEEVLAEKRRRNAGASARFRDRRKQRERELQDKYNILENRTKALADALRRIEPDHPLVLPHQAEITSHGDNSNRLGSASPSPEPHSQNTTDLTDRVSQLERLMTLFRQEKETDTCKLEELEKENFYLRSLLVPVGRPRSHSNGRSSQSLVPTPPSSVSPILSRKTRLRNDEDDNNNEDEEGDDQNEESHEKSSKRICVPSQDKEQGHSTATF
ncbi:hypothetical protein J3Q64DRAFT_1673361 [Phycomyces blakesleeanus]|uniref:BZIP domain-containing protein n=1 Tax=Phycomyces blakesleeanus TaxID=4837 RepID=A0ABR3B722_PHYBL